MRLFSLLTLFFHLFTVSVCQTDNTNEILRSWIPWWPKNEEILLKSTPDSTAIFGDKNFTNVSDGLKSEQLTGHIDAPAGDGENLNLEKLPASPLDSLRDARNTHHSFTVDFSSMADCPRDCSNDLHDTLSLALQDMSHVERYRRVCDKYATAVDCVDDARCEEEERGMFETLTSGLHYMCVEQQLAFNATIKCIDNEAGLIQSECELQCQTKNLFMNWIMRSAMADTIQQGVNGIVGAATGANPNAFSFLEADQAGWASVLQGHTGMAAANPEATKQGLESFRQFTNDLCRIGDCMLDCIRSKFNTRCEGSAGTLLSEVFVRPIAASQDKLSILRPVLGIFMPEQCAYVYSNTDLKKHRIDSTMDSELKRMYSEKMAKELRERAAQDELLSKLVPLDKNGVPLPRTIPELHPARVSPLDGGAKSLDQLILEMYKENSTKAVEKDEKEILLTNDEGSAQDANSNILEGSGDINGENSGLEGSGWGQQSQSLIEGSGDNANHRAAQQSGIHRPEDANDWNFKLDGSGDIEGSGLLVDDILEGSAEESGNFASSKL